MQRMSKSIKNKKIYNICIWVYGMDENTLTSIIKRKIYRNDLIRIELAKWIELKEKPNAYMLKYAWLNEVNRSSLKLSYQNYLWSDLSHSWGIKINEINLSQSRQNK